MHDKTTFSARPYAPLPASVITTRVRLGSWFQTHPKTQKSIAVVALISGLVYLLWRLSVTMIGADPVFFWPLFLAEAFGYVTFAILVFEAWEIPLTPRLEPIDVSVDILITTYNEDVDIVLPTVIGALKVRGNTTIWLCDDGRRPEMKAMAEKYGIKYQVRPDNLHAKAGNINAVLPKLKGQLMLVLDADHVPAPDFLEATTGYFRDPKLALVQTAHSFRNHNSVMHEEEGRHEQSLFFDVLLPGRNRLKSVFWCGSAGLIRRDALLAVGGMAIATSTEDFETSLSLQLAGYEIKYHNEHLVQGLAPDNLEAYTIQRFRWAQGTLGSYRKGGRKAWDRRMTLSQRVSYTGGLLYHLTPIQRLCYTFTLIAVAIFAARPVGNLGGLFIAFWGTWMVLSLMAVVALERGATQPFEGVRNNLIVMEAFLRAIPSLFTKKELPFVVTPKNELDMGGWGSVKLLRLPIFLVAVSLTAILMRWVSIGEEMTTGHGYLPKTPMAGIVVATIFGVIEAVIMTGLAVRIYNRRQIRKLWRFPVDLQTKVNGQRAKAVDLHHAGLSVALPAKMVKRQALKVGSTLKIAIDCRGVTGKATKAYGTLTVTHLEPYASSGNTIRVGGGIHFNSGTSLDAVIEQCYVVEPYAARNRAWARSAPRLPVSLEATVNGEGAQCIDLSVNGAAFVMDTQAGAVGDVVPVTLTLDDDRIINGFLEIKNVRSDEDDVLRVGGLTTWDDTSWLPRYTTLAMAPEGRRKSPIPTI